MWDDIEWMKDNVGRPRRNQVLNEVVDEVALTSTYKRGLKLIPNKKLEGHVYDRRGPGGRCGVR